MAVIGFGALFAGEDLLGRAHHRLRGVGVLPERVVARDDRREYVLGLGFELDRILVRCAVAHGALKLRGHFTALVVTHHVRERPTRHFVALSFDRLVVLHLRVGLFETVDDRVDAGFRFRSDTRCRADGAVQPFLRACEEVSGARTRAVARGDRGAVRRNNEVCTVRWRAVRVDRVARLRPRCAFCFTGAYAVTDIAELGLGRSTRRADVLDQALFERVVLFTAALRAFLPTLDARGARGVHTADRAAGEEAAHRFGEVAVERFGADQIDVVIDPLVAGELDRSLTHTDTAFERALRGELFRHAGEDLARAIFEHLARSTAAKP